MTAPNAAAATRDRQARERTTAEALPQSPATAKSAVSSSATPPVNTASGAGAAAAVTQVAAAPPAVVDQTAMRADSATKRAFAAGGGGRGGGAPAGRATVAAGDAVSQLSATVSNAPPTGSIAAATPPGANLPAPQPTTLTMLAGRAAGTNIGTAARGFPHHSAPKSNARWLQRARLTRAAIDFQLRAPASSPLPRAAPTVQAAASFDSVTLMRTRCAPTCESTTLHVNALGVVRYAVDSGNTQRVVMSQLSAGERSELRNFVLQSFPNGILQRGRTACTSSQFVADRRSPRDGIPAVQLFVDFPGSSTLRPEQRCANSEAELSEIGARVDAIARTSSLKRRVPPED